VWETRMSIKWTSVTAITKEKTARVIPNAILVCTENEKHFLTSFTSRDKTYLMLFRVWQNALMDKPMKTQEMWQWVTKFFMGVVFFIVVVVVVCLILMCMPDFCCWFIL
jgi:hypothetical protein